ncbi:hypothetical protein EDC04DRAFT_2902657 [Pisolithus marmoratus]|nr:hypothetical protein EDC04DRAFT_2902657 [Pisolithus marmoratus]
MTTSDCRPIDPITSAVVKEREPNDMTKESQQKLFMSFSRFERSRALAPGQNPVRKAMQKGEYDGHESESEAASRMYDDDRRDRALSSHRPGLRFAGLDGVASSCSYALDEREQERAQGMPHKLVCEENLESGEENAYGDTGV